LYQLYFTEDGMADVKALPKNSRNSLKRLLIQKLASEPQRHSTELRSPLGAFRSLHWKKYRIVFKVYEELKAVAVVGVGEREPRSASNIYRRLERLAAQGKLAESVLATLRGFSSRQARTGAHAGRCAGGA
jgi:mRNA-degrading endonuclease RelE of RelBE toxin-antitoxin system